MAAQIGRLDRNKNLTTINRTREQSSNEHKDSKGFILNQTQDAVVYRTSERVFLMQKSATDGTQIISQEHRIVPDESAATIKEMYDGPDTELARFNEFAKK